MLRAQQQTADLTVPVAIIVACAAVIVLTLVLQWVRRRRKGNPASPEDLRRWQETSGRLLDQWMVGVDQELTALRESPFPDTVTPTEDPLDLDDAVVSCPDGPLREVIGELRGSADHLLRTARQGDPSGPQTAAAEAAYREVRARAAGQLPVVGESPAAQ